MSERVDIKRVHAVRPTGLTLFLRHFLPWQLLRFLLINIKMTRMILKSRDQKL